MCKHRSELRFALEPSQQPSVDVDLAVGERKSTWRGIANQVHAVVNKRVFDARQYSIGDPIHDRLKFEVAVTNAAANKLFFVFSGYRNQVVLAAVGQRLVTWNLLAGRQLNAAK
jgi:hypothetical protein